MIREEQVCKAILNWLEENDWTIVCYDFPQSGTGVLLHPNNTNRTSKNKGGVIPDVIAVKDGKVVFIENKNRFYVPDFDKLFEIKTTQNYSEALGQLLTNFAIEEIYYGIGMPAKPKAIEKAKTHLFKIDFLISVNDRNEIVITFENERIF